MVPWASRSWVETAEGTCLQSQGPGMDRKEACHPGVGSALGNTVAISVGVELVSSQNWSGPATVPQGRLRPTGALKGA